MTAAELVKKIIPIEARNSIRLLLRRHPIGNRRYWPDLAMFNLRRGDVVFDVGANVGMFVESVLANQPWAEVHAFEPIPSAYEVLTRKLEPFSRVYCRNLALGSQPGRLGLNVSKYNEASSFLELGGTLARGVRGIDFSTEATIPVRVDTLANYVAEHSVGKVKLLKLDVQGYELEVIRGAEPVLGRVEYVYTEAQFLELYKNGPLFNETFEFMAKRGFSLLRMTEFRADDDGKLMECDMVFRNMRF